jgi:glycosyltransferase involved in cell wall biosynthesis
MKKITLLGTFPPPIGGTSIHVYRLYVLLKQFYDVQGVDTHGRANLESEGITSIKNYKRWLVRFIFISKSDIMHSHSHSWNERIILALVAMLKRNKIIFTYHSLRENSNQLPKLKLWLIKYILNYNSTHIVPNSNMEKQLLDYGIKNSNVRVIPTFLLPLSQSDEKCPSYIYDFIKGAEHVVLANASNNNKYEGVDLYGIDLCIELCRKLKKNIDIRLVFCLTKVTDKDYFDEIKNKIINFKLEKNFLIVNDNISLLPIFKVTSLFIRPTYYDSYGISVGESISLGVPCIASDVCKRTNGTILFTNRDFNELFEKTKEVLHEPKLFTNKLNGIKVSDNSYELLEVYGDLLKN